MRKNNMLVKFEVENFKNFKDKLVLSLDRTKGYEFNNHLIKDGIVRGGVIFGRNASGKSNLGLALFDLINNLTDNAKTTRDVMPFRNLDSALNDVRFKYTFKFNNKILEYCYSKLTPNEFLEEELIIDNQSLIKFDYQKFEGYSKLKGTETLNNNIKDNTLSFVRYVKNNSVLEKNKDNEVFDLFINYVEHMLLFYSLDTNRYYGYTAGSESISEGIIKKGKLKEFEQFLNNLEINYKLEPRELDGKQQIYVKFDKGEANFYSIASTGTRALALFYYWTIKSEEVSLIFMDEFDAYYHYELSSYIVKYILKQKNAQILFTSHNTNLMNNDLFRPDCLFIMQNKGIKTMSDLTEKELRQAHNLQKMYKAGAFDE